MPPDATLPTTDRGRDTQREWNARRGRKAARASSVLGAALADGSALRERWLWLLAVLLPLLLLSL